MGRPQPLVRSGRGTRFHRGGGLPDDQRLDRFRVPAAPGRGRDLGTRHIGTEHRTHRRHPPRQPGSRAAGLISGGHGGDLKLLEEKGDQIIGVMRRIPGIQDLGLFRVIGQPNLNLVVDRQKAARYQINVTDVQDAIQTAVGGGAVSQVLQGEERYDLVVRYAAEYRDTREAIEKIRLLAPSGERVSLAQLCAVQTMDGASQFSREGNTRYVAIKYSVRGRDLGSTVEEAIRKGGRQGKLPPGNSVDWTGEYPSQKRSQQRLMVVL